MDRFARFNRYGWWLAAGGVLLTIVVALMFSRLEGAWMKDLYTATGRNWFKPTADGKRTEIGIHCNVELHPDKIPGVPTFLVRPLVPAIEALLKSVLAPNLTLLSQGVKGYLAAQEGNGASAE